jgi:hypothetical protein
MKPATLVKVEKKRKRNRRPTSRGHTYYPYIFGGSLFPAFFSVCHATGGVELDTKLDIKICRRGNYADDDYEDDDDNDNDNDSDNDSDNDNDEDDDDDDDDDDYDSYEKEALV